MDWIINGPKDAFATIVLAHGAGAAMDSGGMDAITAALTRAEFRVARFEFGYMASRREGGRKPPPKAELLRGEFRQAIAQLEDVRPLIIGGKSMGGRVASMIADEFSARREVLGLLCLGYPFHPPAKPQQLRTAHLATLKTPTLICQGTRDPFGTRIEVTEYDLSRAIEIFWLEDGDHDLKPRKTVSGYSHSDHLKAMAERTRSWANGLIAA